MASIFLSPSTQDFNQYYDSSGSERDYMNLVADAMEPYLTASQISFTRNNPNGSAAQSIAQSNMGVYDLHLALHSNPAPESLAGNLQGSDFYFYPRSSQGRRAATVLADNFQSVYPNPSLVKIMPTTSIGEVVRTRAPSVLVEIAYHDNPQDAEWIKNNIGPIARNLSQGVAEFLGVPFVEPSQYDGVREGIVITEGGRLNIRERPDLNANVIAQVPNGQRINVYCNTGLWYVVEYGGILGFAASRYIDLPQG